MMTTNEKREYLKKLGKEAKKNLWLMLKVASEILEDKAWVDENGGEVAVIEQMEATEFSHWGGRPKLATAIRAYQYTPDESIWHEHRYDIRVMIHMSNPKNIAEKKVLINWKQQCAELELKLAIANQKNDELSKQVEALRDLVAQMRARNAMLVGAIA